MIDEIHFYCLQNDTTPGLDDDLLEQFDATEYRHDSPESLIKATTGIEKPLFFDLDLDLFNRSTPHYGEGEKLNSVVSEFISRFAHLIDEAAVVTIAKSPGYWWVENEERGDWDRELADDVFEIVAPRILSIRKKTT